MSHTHTRALVVLLRALGGDAPSAPTDGGAISTDARPAADAFVPSRALVRAAEGGEVRSADGVFTLIIPPGSLAADTEIGVEAIDAPADVASRPLVSAYYDVQPDGLTFIGEGAYTVFRYPSAPAGLVSGTEYAMIGAYSRSADGTIEPHAGIFPLYDDDGSLTIMTRLAHLSGQWVERGTLRVDADFGETDHVVGETWAMTSMTLTGTSGRGGQDVVAGESALSAAQHVPFGDGPHVRRGLLLDEGSFSFNRSGEDITRWEATPVVPTPRFACRRVGRGSIYAGAGGRVDPIEGWTLDYSLFVRVPVDCAEGPARPPIPTRLVLLANDMDAAATGRDRVDLPDPAPGGQTGATALVLAPGPSILASLEGVGPDALAYHEVTTADVAADAPTIVATGAGNGFTATPRPSGYVVTGLDPDADALTDGADATFDITPAGVGPPVRVVVADPVDPPFWTWAVRAGDDTMVRFPDGAATHYFVHAVLAPDSGSPRGESGFYRFGSMGDLTLTPGPTDMRELPLRTSELAAWQALHGLSIQLAVACAVAVVEADSVDLTVMAGQCFTLDAADIAPAPPSMTAPCSSAPFTITETDPFSPGASRVLGRVCQPGDAATCTITELTCPAGGEIFALSLGGERLPDICRPDFGWAPIYTSFGGLTSLFCAGSIPPRIPEGTESSMVWHRVGDGARVRVRFTASADPDELVVHEAAPFAGALPDYGASHDCATLPRTFGPPAGGGTHARVCASHACRVYGDVVATPESEFCRAGAGSADSWDLAFDTTPGEPRALAGYRTSSPRSTTIESASHGAISGPSLTGFPPDVDVTVVSLFSDARETTRATTVFRYVSATDSFTIRSAAITP